MNNKIYRVNDKQFNSVMETLMKEREITETSINKIDETIESENDFEVELDYLSIDTYDKNSEFKKNIFSSLLGEYDIDLQYEKAKIRYDISIEYRRYGIRSFTIEPKSVNLMGELIIEDDDGVTKKNFEISYTSLGLQTNTLSGEVRVGDKTMTIGNLPKKAIFQIKDVGGSDGVYVTSLSIEETPNEFIFIFEY